ncbi:MAG: GAF and ANTAR domain-containing protein [Acidimicrobiales bacterium]
MDQTEGPVPAETDVIVELFDEFSCTTRTLHAAVGVRATLQAIVDLAVDTVEACDAAGIFVLDDGGGVSNPVYAGVVASHVDALQISLQEGPCLDAIAKQGVFYAADLADDPRWASFGPEASAGGFRCLLAFPLRDDGTLGALNLYARYPSAFGIIDRAKASLLATLAGPTLARTQVHEAEEIRAENLQAALVTRELIGQALGILMERERISGEQAFDILRRASQHLNVKLREVARRLVDTGERPKTGGLPELPRTTVS